MPRALRIVYEGAVCHVVNRGERAGQSGAVGAGGWKLRWREAELPKRRKGDPAKVRIARRLRLETTMTPAWIAQRLRMGPGRMCRTCCERSCRALGMGDSVNGED